MKKIHNALPKIKTIRVSAVVRYWEDSEINGEPDTEQGTFIPLRDGDNWCPVIDVETGIIEGWPQGTTANIHYKVCDRFNADFLDAEGNIVVDIEDEYVPHFMSPFENGFGDYIIMEIDATGKIEDWSFQDNFVTED